MMNSRVMTAHKCGFTVMMLSCTIANGFMPLLEINKLSKKRDCKAEVSCCGSLVRIRNIQHPAPTTHDCQILPNIRTLESNFLDASFGDGGGVGLSGGIEIAIDDDLCARMLHRIPKDSDK